MMHRNKILASNEITTGYRISYLANFLVGPIYKEIAKTLGVSRSEFVVVFCLHHLGTLTAQDICAITGRPKNSISQAVGKLQRAGHVQRRTDPSDARRAPLVLTAKGRAMYERVIPLFRVREHKMLSVFSARERKQFDRLLEKVVLRDDDWAQSY
jgi:DNA-binding MarR family transcriptional regulator